MPASHEIKSICGVVVPFCCRSEFQDTPEVIVSGGNMQSASSALIWIFRVCSCPSQPSLKTGSFGKVHVVDGINNWRSRQRAAIEVPAVEALEGAVASSNIGKLDIDFAVRTIAENTNVDDFAVFRTALFFEVLFKVFGPVRVGLAGSNVSKDSDTTRKVKTHVASS